MKNITKVLALGLIITLCSFAAEWLAFQNKEGRFKAMFPRAPKASEESVSTAIGNLKMKMFMYDVGNYKDDNAAYGIIYSDYPDSLISSDFKDEILETFFKNTIEGAVENMKGEVVNKKDIVIEKYPGREIKVSFAEGEGIMYMRIYLVKSRMYFVQVACEKAKDNNPSIAKFMNSFALTSGK